MGRVDSRGSPKADAAIALMPLAIIRGAAVCASAALDGPQRNRRRAEAPRELRGVDGRAVDFQRQDREPAAAAAVRDQRSVDERERRRQRRGAFAIDDARAQHARGVAADRR